MEGLGGNGNRNGFEVGVGVGTVFSTFAGIYVLKGVEGWLFS